MKSVTKLSTARNRKRAAFAAAVVIAFCVPYLALKADGTPAMRDRPAAAAKAASARGAASSSSSLRVIDGDTIELDGERIRLQSEAGPIDAPEMRKAQCPLELFRAQAARERLAKLLDGSYSTPEGRQSTLSIDRRGADRYGRTIAVVRVGGVDVSSTLLREGHVKPWPKLRKADRPTWCGG